MSVLEKLTIAVDMDTSGVDTGIGTVSSKMEGLGNKLPWPRYSHVGGDHGAVRRLSGVVR